MKDLVPDVQDTGRQMYEFAARLYPLCRSITGAGVRETLAEIGRQIPLDIAEVPSGTPVFDWTVPKEWNIRDAYIKNSRGERIVDFQRSNLHVVGYSVPIKAKMSLSELRPHLHALPDHPDWVPYRTSYYQEAWGFCVSQTCLDQLEEGEYEVGIDSSLEPGHLTYGECLLKGEGPEEVLFSAHTCHPSLCNDNLSGIALATFLAKALADRPRRYTYRFIFAPGTIGAITWLALNQIETERVQAGLILACVGDAGPTTYKLSRRGNSEIDQAVTHVLKQSGAEYSIQPFPPYGYDERQYCSPGFNLPLGCFMRTPPGGYPQYHTSADDPSLVRPEYLADSFAKCLQVVEILEANETYLNRNPYCEPQLGRRGLYTNLGGQTDKRVREQAMLWVLNLSDGVPSLLDIAEQASLPFTVIHEAANALRDAGLLARIASREV